MKKAQSLRIFLSFMLVVSLAGAAGVFYLGLEQVRTLAVEVTHTQTDAAASEKQIGELETLKVQLAERKALVDKANLIYATEADWQAQSLKDIQTYANRAGVSISKTEFGSSAETPVVDRPETIPGTPPSAGKTITVTLQSSTTYSKLLAFLDGIEGNIPKMQVSTLSLKHVENGNADSIEVSPIVIEVSTR